MHRNMRVDDLAAEVLTRQARARAERTGETFEVALEAVLETEAGRASSKGCATGGTAARARGGGRKTSRANGPKSASKPDEKVVVSMLPRRRSRRHPGE